MEDEAGRLKEEEEEAESHFDFVLAVVVSSRIRPSSSVARRSTISITPGEFAGLPCARNEIARKTGSGVQMS